MFEAALRIAPQATDVPATAAALELGKFLRSVMGREVEHVKATRGALDVLAYARPLGRLRLCKLVSGPYDVRCARDPGHNLSLPTAGEWQVCLQISGETDIEHGPLQNRLRAGEWGLNARPDAFRVYQRAQVEQLVLVAPRDQLPTDVLALGASMTRAHPADRGATRVFAQAMMESLRQLDSIPGTSHEAVAQSLICLLRAALLESAEDHASGGVRGSRLLHERAMSYLRAHMSDPDLSPASLANALACSKRYLHVAFQHTGSTPMQALLQLRLAHCGQSLREPHLAQRSVNSIALAAGFRDATHFGRLFRGRFGVTPGEWRRQAMPTLNGG